MRPLGRTLAIAAIIALVPIDASGQAPASPQQVRATFQSPPKAYRPMVRWFWPGGDVRDNELRREIRVLDEAHFGGAEIQPFRFGLDPAAPADVLRRVNDYRTPTFYGHVRAALTEASRRRMWIDYTFGSGWPFGGGLNITPELSALELRSAHRSVTGPGRFTDRIPWPVPPPGFGSLIAKVTGWKDDFPSDWPARLKARERLVAVVAIRGSAAVAEVSDRRDLIGNPLTDVKRVGVLDAGTAVVLTDRVGPDRTLDWAVPEGEWQLFALVQFPVDQRVLGGVGGTPQLVLDHLSRQALDAHIRATGDSAVKYLGHFVGGSLRGVFFDSLELAAEFSWTPDFLEQFRRLRGYDLTPVLPFLDAAYDQPEVAGRVRYDYARTVSDLLIERLYAPFAAWAGHNGLLARIQAHGAPADELRIYGLANIPETENLHAGGRYDFLKLAGSAAHVYGRPITSAESFVWLMEEYQTTPEKLKRSADGMLAAGVNQIVASGFPYEYLDRPEPGWYPFVSPFPYASHLNQHDPFWGFIRPFNDYLTRLQYLSRAGAVVRPVALFQSGFGFSTGPADAPVVELARRLLAAGYDFDHLNAHALLAARVVNRRLITSGGATYDQLVMGDVEQLEAQVVERLAQFSEAGLPILLVGKRPTLEVGYQDYQARTARIRLLVDAMIARPAGVRTAATAPDAVDVLKATVTPNLRFAGSTAGLNFIQIRIGALDAYFVRNGSADERVVDVTFPRARGRAERWDPWTGSTSPIAPTATGDAGSTLSLRVEPYGSTLVVFDRTRPALPVRASRPSPAPRVVPVGAGAERWSFRAVGRVGRGEVSVHERSITPLFDWATDSVLKDFSGRGRYRIEFTLDSALAGTRVELDLGVVRDVAEIRVNGRRGPTLLLRPYRADVTSLLRRGRNALEVTITNPPLNRMIGSGMRLGMLFAESYSRPPARLPAGLLGPVRLLITPSDHAGH